ncbi:hypothetical protein QTH89_21560 [Variovorax sp. J22G21]|uniref:hypothetical protein n=1 Tax=Variovorax fucosicus TaxID=3053517 RepID=UPI0025752AF1|nr:MULTISPECIES: hypothetical protein [unclassified Variovorax]MDM0039036.1 hypothetical protein [Variovorax sp. J22R193]MDM0055367.1 hypothetical protein [Variovorax sp. J22G47]MDM0063812.1 hypothetical protein [Variovorax sp. J22G21]
MEKQKQFRATMLAMALVALPPLVAAICVVVLGGCASPSYPITPQAHANAARENPPPPKDEDFLKLSPAKWDFVGGPVGDWPGSARGNRSGGWALAARQARTV